MVAIVEIDPGDVAGAPRDADLAAAPEDDARARAFFNMLPNMPEKEVREKLAELQREVAAPSVAAPSCMREGWWYEDVESPAAAQDLPMSRLQGVAKASGDSAARAGEWQVALDHYYSAMEVSWKRRPGGGDELGTLHSNCSLCELRLGRGVEALEHADTAARMRPTWAKAHGRRAAALEALGKFIDASVAYAEAERQAETRGEATDYARARLRAEGTVRTDAMPAVAPQAAAGASALPARLEEREAMRKEGAEEREEEEEEEDDVGAPLGEPVAFEPARARVTRGSHLPLPGKS